MIYILRKNKRRKNKILLQKNKGKKVRAFLLFTSIFLLGLTKSVSAVEKIDGVEGSDITIDSLSTIFKNLAVQLQVIGVIIALVMLVVTTVQFIAGDEQKKEQKKRNLILTLIGVAILILAPALINFIIGLFDT